MTGSVYHALAVCPMMHENLMLIATTKTTTDFTNFTEMIFVKSVKSVVDIFETVSARESDQREDQESGLALVVGYFSHRGSEKPGLLAARLVGHAEAFGIVDKLHGHIESRKVVSSVPLQIAG